MKWCEKSYGYYDLIRDRALPIHLALGVEGQDGEQGPFPNKETPKECTTEPPVTYTECWRDEPVSNYITELVIGNTALTSSISGNHDYPY